MGLNPRFRLASILLGGGAASFAGTYSLFRVYAGEGADTRVLVWWAALSAVSLVNVAAWVVSARAYLRRRAQSNRLASRLPHLWLSGIYVLVCAFRSFFPRADVQRICLFDSWISTVLVGRAVATVAELAFAAQWALLMGEVGRDFRRPVASAVSRLILPLIAFAELCSWYAVITTSYLGNSLEESTWTVTVLLICLSLIALWPQVARRSRSALLAVLAGGLAYVAFMSTVDVPMYVNRFLGDEAAGRRYLTFGEGFADLASRWIVTYRWEDWRTEMAWMGLYFSVAVWFSILAVHFPRLKREVRL